MSYKLYFFIFPYASEVGMNKNIFGIKPAAALGLLWKNIINEMEIRIRMEKRKNNLIRCFDNIEDLSSYIISELRKNYIIS